MVLAVDVGNTNIVVGCAQRTESDRMIFAARISTNRNSTEIEYAMSIKTILELNGISPDDIEGAIISSVVPPVTLTLKTAIKLVTGCDALVVGPGIKTGLSIVIDNPAQLGADLAVAAVAGINKYPLPLIIIDMGTASTVSVVDENRNYVGGMIMPGIVTALESLTERTSQLPRISLDAPKRIVGTNTVDCMKSGMLYGTAAALDGIILRINELYGRKHTVIATGGLSATVVPLCREEIIHDADLLLKGLMIIYKKNQ